MSDDVFVHPSSVCEGAHIGRGTKIWHFCHVMEGAHIGEHCVLGQGCFIAAGVVMGSRVRLQNQVSVYDGVRLEDEVFCGPGVVFTNVRRPRAAFSQRECFATTLVKRGATLGANATICPGVTIGSYAFVAAGAVVTRDVRDHSEVRGVPARHAAWVSRAGQPLVFERGRALCPRDGDEYVLVQRGAECSVERVAPPAESAEPSR